jgi:DNA-directed RNA polymerase subunit K/omega
MSDDEGEVYDEGDGADEFDDANTEANSDVESAAETVEGAPAEGESGDEIDPEEDAGGSAGSAASESESDEESIDSDEEAAERAEREPRETDEVGETQRALQQKTKVDPILRMSNAPRRIIVVPDEERVTSNWVCKSEAAYLIAMRAEQIANFSTNYVENDLKDPMLIAFKEFLERRCPLTLRRVVATGSRGELYVEKWNTRVMVHPPLTAPAPLGASSNAKNGGAKANSAQARGFFC